MVYAEKIVTMLERGDVNTRWRDFADVYLLCARMGLTATNWCGGGRGGETSGAPLRALLPELDGLAGLAQLKWAAWVRKEQLDDRLLQDFEETLLRVAEFADPALTGKATGLAWDPRPHTWLECGGGARA